MFDTVLIANRGEIACRIAATCRRLGVRAVAVYSEADADARHVRVADEAYCLGPAPANQSYLDVERVLDAARQSGAQAIHPGYGFLSENARFARACEDAGIVFIGPPAAAIEAMGSKSAAKTLMGEAGVPLVPGYHGDEQAVDQLRAEADRIGYPVLIKASAGGGGKGMRVVRDGAAFANELAACQRESRASFGDDRVLIEKYLEQPRHVEIQVFADAAGETISLFERDCSSQRRYQKIVEEAPAPDMDPELRAQMGRAACDAARAVGYVGAGTVEFIVDTDRAFYFMEMNTRLQVEHPVTEMITGQDLVEWQLRVAAGEPLPVSEDALAIDGHAIEVRVYAEDPAHDFQPSVGRLTHFVAPTESPHVRLDTGVEEGDAVTPHYDPMIAKLIVWDVDRDAAIARLLQTLAETRIVGVQTNLDFAARLIDHPEFRAGRVDTGLIQRAIDALLPAPSEPPRAVFQAAALALAAEQGESAARADPDSPWATADGWRINGVQNRRLAFDAGSFAAEIDLAYAREGLQIDGLSARLLHRVDRDYDLVLGDQRQRVTLVGPAEARHVFMRGGHYVIAHRDPLTEAVVSQDAPTETTAPMPGSIVALSCEPGSRVEAGEPILIMEAMKMEITIRAPAGGTLERYYWNVGDSVSEGAELVEFTPEADT